MTVAYSMKYPGEGRLWLIAGSLSLVLNVVILSLVGIAAIESQRRRENTVAAPPAESAVFIYPQQPAAVPETPPEAPVERPFARTSPGQEAKPEAPARFVGERDTAARSERAAKREAPALPSQDGIEPRYKGEFETTESDYQDGILDESPVSAASMDSAPNEPTVQATAENSAASTPPQPPTPPAETLYSGPTPIDVPVLAESPAEPDAIKPTETVPETPAAEPVEEVAPEPPSPASSAAPKEKKFSGFQRRTAFVGSISRTGRSSLDVENTALGRYQARISRAVELEWQRNCVRHRDFITPGYLTARFFIDANGKVKSVQFIGEMQTGEIQKGFTLNSIRDADIPPMPASLRNESRGEPLELVFRFFF